MLRRRMFGGLLAVCLGVAVAAAPVLLDADPGIAAGVTASVGMPFTGRWAYNVDKLNVFGVIGYLVPSVGPEILNVSNSNKKSFNSVTSLDYSTIGVALSLPCHSMLGLLI